MNCQEKGHTIRHLDLLRAAEVVALASSLVCVGLVLVAVGQPIFSDDTWWHLALGRSYAHSGLWLESDPLLFTAASAPSPASWVADLLLYDVFILFGFSGLRLFHVATVLGILALVWSTFYDTHRNRLFASVGTALFATISAYRLVQLRPHLGTILATLLLYRLLLHDQRLPSWRRVAASVLIMVLWANYHPSYPIGIALIGASAMASFVVSTLQKFELPSRNAESRRATRLGIAALLGGAVSGINPTGFEGLRRAIDVSLGEESLAFVVDEWASFDPFAMPSLHLPPTPLAWIATWVLMIAVAVVAFRAITRVLRADGAAHMRPRVALMASALVGLTAMISANRFVWMSVFPIALLVHAATQFPRCRLIPAAASMIGVLLVPAFVGLGDWPMTTRGLPGNFAGYRTDYAAGKYHASAVWLMDDAGLEGNLFGRYSAGGFQSFWLGPEIRTAMNGTLNMDSDAFRSAIAIRERRGTHENPHFDSLLDSLGVDLFLGSGLPMESRANRPSNYSTTYLDMDDQEKWILIFRNLDSALYLRRNERNATNLAKVICYFSSRGVPFDEDRGFEVDRVVAFAPDWAKSKAIPAQQDWRAMIQHGETDELADIASIELALGRYAAGASVDQAILAMDPNDFGALKRYLWRSLRPGHKSRRPLFENRIDRLGRHASATPASVELVHVARRVLAGESIAQSRLWSLPVFSRQEARAVLGRAPPVEIRERKPRRGSKWAVSDGSCDSNGEMERNQE